MNRNEKELFKKVFNVGGQILDFSINTFNSFTKNSVGVELCKKYGLSKGKSFEAFIDEANDSKIYKLCFDLMEYSEINNFVEGLSQERKALFANCKKILLEEKKNIDLLLPTINSIDVSYIRKTMNAAYIDINNSNYDSAITKSRTLIEESFIYAIEKKNELPIQSGNINKLYQQFKQLYQLHQNQDVDRRINDLLSGMDKIITSISNMRNDYSDSHGRGSKRITIQKHTSILFVNTSIILCEYILSICSK